MKFTRKLRENRKAFAGVIAGLLIAAMLIGALSPFFSGM